MPPLLLDNDKNRIGIIGWKSRDSLPKLVDDYLAGKIALDALITHRYAFDEINKAFDHMKAGEGLVAFICIIIGPCYFYKLLHILEFEPYSRFPETH